MSATVADLAARSSAAAASSQASRYVLKSSSDLTPAVAAAVVGYRYKEAVGKGFRKITGRRTLNFLPDRSSIVCQPNSAALPSLSLSQSPYGLNPIQHIITSKESPSMNISSTSTSLFKFQDGESSYNLPKLPRRASIKPAKAYKSFHSPVLAEKPEWWWRTLACVPYLIALQISAAGYYIQPLLEHYGCFENLIFFVPGAITRLPMWFTLLYCFFAYGGIVKNKECPHFFRFHLMMGLLLETSLQIVWFISNFFPLIHYKGRLGMYYWAGVGFAYILVLLQCVRCALAGGYAHVPFISENAYIHTQFNIGGLQRPW
ncbi:unnamed protein product [Linum tenue]|uniref:Protein TIC 20 n=1 Tax=Linum tenue TaxID=586396 RepID=A0AAV0NRA6_9ROSI|nr:unnamed protein product [Linum tenue]